MWSSDDDPYAESDLDRVLTREADDVLMADTDPEGYLHGVAGRWSLPGLGIRGSLERLAEERPEDYPHDSAPSRPVPAYADERMAA